MLRRPNIVMECVQGGLTVHAHCYAGSLLPFEDVVRIIFKAARALDFAHREGIVHRDIKPKNVLFTTDRDVKISDSGVALLTHMGATETQVDGVVGSPLYMAPELLREEEATIQSNVFSVGVMMSELPAGKQLFAADNLPSIIYKITERPHRPLHELRKDTPAILQHIVGRC